MGGSHVYAFEQARKCRVCGCSQDRIPTVGKRLVQGHEDFSCCFELVPVWRGGPQVVRRICSWVAPDLCSFCAEDGGPKNTRRDNPDHYSGLLDRFGEPLLKSEFLPE
jgi:hypothetical protein